MKKIIIVSIIIIFIIGDFGSSIIANGIPDPINFFNAKSNEYVIIINVTEDEAMMDGHQFHSNENHLGVGDRQGIAGPWRK